MPSSTMDADGSSARTFPTDVGKSVWSAPSVPPAMFSGSPTTSRHERERVLDRLIGPRDLVARQLVVEVRAGAADVDVLEQVRQRPAVGAGDRVRRQPGGLDGLGGRDHVVERRGRLYPGRLVGRDVVPAERLAARLEQEAVEGAFELRDLRDGLAVVLDHHVAHEVERQQVAGRGELADEAGLGGSRQIGRVAALDRRRQQGGQVVAGRVVGDLDVRVLLAEAVEHGLEVLRLDVLPDAHDRDLARDVLGRGCRSGLCRSRICGSGLCRCGLRGCGLRGGGLGRCGLLVVAPARGCREREHGDE